MFRVNEQEYNCLKSACDAAGGHSLSEYTRSELLSGMHNGSSEALLLQRFLEIERKLTKLHELTNQMLECMLAAGIDRGS